MLGGASLGSGNVFDSVLWEISKVQDANAWDEQKNKTRKSSNLEVKMFIVLDGFWGGRVLKRGAF